MASLVQYVPLPVVGSFLAYVGYFCLTSGITVATGVQVTLGSWTVARSIQSELALDMGISRNLLM